MEPVNNLRDAMFQAGRFGHVEAVQGDDQVSYQVRKGFGNWLVHVVKWYSNKDYKERIIEQRTVVLARLGKLCGSLNQPETQSPQSLSGERVQELNWHLRHGLRFQAQSMRILNTVNTPVVAKNLIIDIPEVAAKNLIIEAPKVAAKKYAVAEGLIDSQFRTADAALKNLIIPGSNDDPQSHEGVNKEKFGAAYWKYAHEIALGDGMDGVTDDSGRLKVNGGVALLEYALSKDEDKNNKETYLYQLRPIQKNNNLGIDFNDWGIPDDIGDIELRLIGGTNCRDAAKTTVSIGGAKGREALAADSRDSRSILEQPGNQKARQMFERVYGMGAQLSELCEQFMQDEEIGGDSVPS